MRNVFTLDTSALDNALTATGIEQTWKALLATRVARAGERFAYILEAEFLKGASRMERDLLQNLSIGEISVLYEYCVSQVDSSSRKDNGQYFTPDDVSSLMVREALEFRPGKWLDPCAGIGNLAWHLVNAQKDKEEFLRHQLVLADKDGLALEIARVLFTLSFQATRPNLYHEIRACFAQFDFLSVADRGEATLFENGQLDAIPAHDFVIVNPPYLGLKKDDSRFETAKSRDLYAYFLENIIKTSSGFVSVTPQSFTNAAKFSGTRRLLLEHYSSLKIYAFDNIPGNIFYGVKFGSSNSNSANSIRAAITVAKQNGTERKITSLLRWRTSERNELFSKIPEFLAESPLSAAHFPKIGTALQEFYRQLEGRPTLGSYLSSSPTDHVLYIPAAPRYFISALKRPVSRSSMKKIYFHNNDDLHLAYILLNSSIMYWWWRVMDGGMTLALETIKSLPMPRFNINFDLINRLEDSEINNKVYKKNAGSLHENVKHDVDLVSMLNEHIAPNYSKRLLRTHENSDLVQLNRQTKE